MTCRRAEYSRLKSVLREIKNDKSFKLQLIVTGTHLLPEFGNTIDVIKKDKFHIEKVIHLSSTDDTGIDMALTFGQAVIEFTKAFKKLKPDVVLVTADLGFHLAATIAAAHMNILIAHIQGGEVTGSIDESLRHAITKFSHIHFASNEDAKNRIERLGENPDYVFNVGSPDLDIIREQIDYKKILPRHILYSKLGLDSEKDILLFIQHPVTTEVNNTRRHIKNSIDAIKKASKEFHLQIVAIFPNDDAGGRIIVEELKQAGINIFKNLDFETYISLLSKTRVMVGNSSSAIREAPTFKIPVVNIGSRQNKRLRARNVKDVNNTSVEIFRAIKYVMTDSNYNSLLETCENPYGDGRSSRKITTILKTKHPRIQKEWYG